ncbi:hypothetical protein ACFFMP_13585 [Pseudoroseomonas cervicalis]|uniref:Uncharacterized protein n=1 Tax=Pseudoroseomonas cervicalis ATCC 49957 TaxID=525371 RepID=D5RJM6_9PROT|nr:hypothetical protein [Pseudoroseomonas cervicalis]EFH12510.1 hypothetical protein HMPREF0731_1286 [Pseudoroseomonas cervicalis ATCC 49957]
MKFLILLAGFTAALGVPASAQQLSPCRWYSYNDVQHFGCLIDRGWGSQEARHAPGARLPIATVMADLTLSIEQTRIHRTGSVAVYRAAHQHFSDLQRAGEEWVLYRDWLRVMMAAFGTQGGSEIALLFKGEIDGQD